MKSPYLLLTALSVVMLAASGAVKANDLPMGDSTPVLRVGTITITESDLQQKYGPQLFDAQKKLYDVKNGLATQIARDMLFNQAAQSAGLTRVAWEKREIDDKVVPPTPQEIDQIIGQMQGGQPSQTNPAQTAQLRQQATAYLTQQKRAAAENAAYAQLTQKTPVEVLLAKPIAPRIAIADNPKINPAKGPKDAQVTIEEFTDFQCPWCKRSQPVLEQVETTYQGKIKLVVHSFPLPMHPQAEPAAEAALCANLQGKYWQYREKLFDKQQLSDAELKQYAKNLNLNEKKFDRCIADHKFKDAVQGDIALGQQAGVQGTPTFFVNGIKVNFNELDSTVKDELAKTAVTK